MENESEPQNRVSRPLLIVIVSIAIFLDNILVSCIIPILPNYLYDMIHPNKTLNLSSDQSPAFFNESTAETRHKELMAESVPLGLFFASKPLVQLLTNPLVGALTHKIGYTIPMFTGFVILTVSIFGYAFSTGFVVLFLMRLLQGVGSSFGTVSGLGILAEQYPDDEERGKMMSFTMGAIAVGLLLGPPYGGVMYHYFGKTVTFVVLGMLAVGDGILQCCVIKPKIQQTDRVAPSMKALLLDPYIMIAAGSTTVVNLGIGLLEQGLPLRMIDTMGADELQQGLVFLPFTITYVIGMNIFGRLGYVIGRWRTAFVGIVLASISLIGVPFAKNPYHLIAPFVGIGCGTGMVESTMMPELGYLVDQRHTSAYGNVYALGDLSISLAFVLGPTLGGFLIGTVGFEWATFALAICSILYSPFLILLPKVRCKEQQPLITTDSK